MAFLKAARRATSSGATVNGATFTTTVSINGAAKGLLMPAAPREASRNASSLRAVKSKTKSGYPLQFWPAQVFSGRGACLTLADHASRRAVEQDTIDPHRVAALLQEIAGHRLDRNRVVPRASLDLKEERARRSRVVVRGKDRVTRATIEAGFGGGGPTSAIDTRARGGGRRRRRVLSAAQGLVRTREEGAAVSARGGMADASPMAATVLVGSPPVENKWKALERMSAEWTIVAKKGQLPLGSIERRPLEEVDRGVAGVTGSTSAAAVGGAASPRMFDGSLREHGDAGRWEKAVELLGQMRVVNAHPDVLTYNAVISACARGRQPEKGLNILREMSESAKEEGAVVAPDRGSYSAAIRGCEEGRRWEQAVVLLREMATVGLTPDVACFGGAVRACGFCSQGEMVEALLTEMLVVGVVPGVTFWNAAITACGGGGQWKLAVDLLVRMESAGVPPNVASYCSAMTACGHAGQCEQAVDILRRLSSKTGTTPRPTDRCYRAAMAAVGNGGGRFEQVLSLLQEMPRVAGITPGDKDYRAAISAVGNCGEWREALSLLREMSSVRGLVPSLASYNAAVKACTDSGEHGEAEVLLNEMGDAGIATWWVATQDSAVPATGGH